MYHSLDIFIIIITKILIFIIKLFIQFLIDEIFKNFKGLYFESLESNRLYRIFYQRIMVILLNLFLKIIYYFTILDHLVSCKIKLFDLMKYTSY